MNKKLLKFYNVMLVIELLAQKQCQFFTTLRDEESGLQPAPPQKLPSRGHHVEHEHLLDYIDGINRGADLSHKLVVFGGILAGEQQWRPKQVERCGRRD